MRTIIFSSQTYDRESFLNADCPAEIELHFQPARLSLDTAALADRHEVVCAFINDDLSAAVLERLAAGGTRLIALRSAGYNHVDLPRPNVWGWPSCGFRPTRRMPWPSMPWR